MVQYQEGYDSNYLWTETYIKLTIIQQDLFFFSGCVKLKIF